nr:MAG TPA: hypothetical protein [Caudoviricetes sp.]
MQSFFLVRACQMQRSQPLSVVPCRQLSICDLLPLRHGAAPF